MSSWQYHDARTGYLRELSENLVSEPRVRALGKLEIVPRGSGCLPRHLIDRMPSIGGAENAAYFAYPPK
jgi:hypothetical protein